MSMEHAGIPCPVCAETLPERFRVFFDGHVKLYRCRSCRHIAQYPGPGAWTITEDYGEEGEQAWAGERLYQYPWREGSHQDICRRVRAVTDGSPEWLDIGCGDGHFVKVAEGYGFRASGVEPSRFMADHARQRVGVSVTHAPYGRDLFPPESFDIISLIQVLEHIPDPGAFLGTIRQHLRPGGTLVVEVPSVQAPHFLAYRCTGVKWFVRPPEGVIKHHCQYFSPASLRRLVAKSGFGVTELATGRWAARYPGLLGALGRILDPLFQATGVGGILMIARKV